MNDEKEDPAYRSRASRLDKWKELYVRAQKELQMPEATPNVIKCLVFWIWLGRRMKMNEDEWKSVQNGRYM